MIKVPKVQAKTTKGDEMQTIEIKNKYNFL